MLRKLKTLAYFTVLSFFIVDPVSLYGTSIAGAQSVVPYDDPMPDRGTAVGGENDTGDFVPFMFDAAGNLLVNGGGSSDPAAIYIDPTDDAAAAITSARTAAVASNLVLKAAAGNLYGLSVTSGATAGYVLVFDAAALPSDGAVTPAFCWRLPSTSSMSAQFAPGPASRFATGITIGFSSTGCFTLTASATAFISGEAM